MRYQPTPVVGNMPSAKIDELLLNLEDSKTINIAYHADDPQVGMSLTADYGKYKLYVGDTGLFVTLAFWDKDFTENIIYNKLLSDKLSAKTHFYEIDFLLSRGNKLCPIEVKSSGYKTHASLDAFCHKYSDRIGQRYLIYTKDLQKDEQTLLLPVYMTPLL